MQLLASLLAARPVETSGPAPHLKKKGPSSWNAPMPTGLQPGPLQHGECVRGQRRMEAVAACKGYGLHSFLNPDMACGGYNSQHRRMATSIAPVNGKDAGGGQQRRKRVQVHRPAVGCTLPPTAPAYHPRAHPCVHSRSGGSSVLLPELSASASM